MKNLIIFVLGLLCIISIVCARSEATNARQYKTRFEMCKSENVDMKSTVSILRKSNAALLSNIRIMESELRQMRLPRANIETVKVSFYCPKLKGINGKPGQSAVGIKLKDGWSVAVSRDLVNAGWSYVHLDLHGSNLPVKWRGLHYSADKMAPHYKGVEITKQIDIFVSDPKMIPGVGVYNDVKISRVYPENYEFFKCKEGK